MWVSSDPLNVRGLPQQLKPEKKKMQPFDARLPEFPICTTPLKIVEDQDVQIGCLQIRLGLPQRTGLGNFMCSRLSRWSDPFSEKSEAGAFQGLL